MPRKTVGDKTGAKFVPGWGTGLPIPCYKERESCCRTLLSLDHECEFFRSFVLTTSFRVIIFKKAQTLRNYILVLI